MGGYVLLPAAAAIGTELIAFARNPVIYCATNAASCVGAVDVAAGTAAGVPLTGVPVPHAVPNTGTVGANSIPSIDRAEEATKLFSSTSPRSGIQIGNRSFVEMPNNGNAKVFSGATDVEDQQYFLELTGSSQLPTARTIPGKGAIYVVNTPEGNFSLRDFSTSSGQTGSSWTIDIPKGATGTTYNPEIKFLRGSKP